MQSDAKLKKSLTAFDEVNDALKTWDGIYKQNLMLETGVAFNSELFHIARTLLRLAAENEKPNADASASIASRTRIPSNNSSFPKLPFTMTWKSSNSAIRSACSWR